MVVDPRDEAIVDEVAYRMQSAWTGEDMALAVRTGAMLSRESIRMLDPLAGVTVRAALHEFFHVAPGCRGEECPLVKPGGAVDRVAELFEAYTTMLREALDDLWGCIGKAEIDQLQPETVEVAKTNHEVLWHANG